MLECIYIVRNCVGNIVKVCDEDPRIEREVCETCGDYVSRTDRVWFVRSDSLRTVSWGTVDPRSVGVSFADIRCADALSAKGEAVYITPEILADCDAMYGRSVN